MFWLPVSDSSRTGEWHCRGGVGDPVQLIRQQTGLEQGRVILAFYYLEDIILEIFADDKPWLTRTTDAQSLALADSVVHQAIVLSDNCPIKLLNITWLGGQVLSQKIAKTPFTDKTYAGAVFTVVVRQLVFVCNFSYC